MSGRATASAAHAAADFRPISSAHVVPGVQRPMTTKGLWVHVSDHFIFIFYRVRGTHSSGTSWVASVESQPLMPHGLPRTPT